MQRRAILGWAAAILISLLLHVLILGGIRIDFGFLKPEPDVVSVHLGAVGKPEQQKMIAPVQQAVPAQAHTEDVLPEPLLDEVPQSSEEVSATPEPAPTDDTVPPISETAAIAPEAVADQNSALVSTDVQQAADLAPPELKEERPQPHYHVESDFDILRGIGGTKIGQTHIRYEANQEGSYQLESISEAKGLASLLIASKLEQRSEGLLSEQGLVPQRFEYVFGKNKMQRARFDWEHQQILLETSKQSLTQALPTGSQDLLSFMYQFMFVPPLEQMQLHITNGKRLKEYSYSFVGEEDMLTAIGMLRTLHIENINDDGDEKTEIWLATDLRYLPVKIRKTEEDGSVIEQVITQLKTDMLQ